VTAPRNDATDDDAPAAASAADAHVARRRAVAADYDAGAAGYDDRHGDRTSLARAHILDAPLLAAARDAHRVLEIGVGTGRLLAQVAATVRVGVDVAPAMLARARARAGLSLVLADGARLPFAAASFDAVLAGKGALRYLAPDHALAETARVLRPGGALALHLYGARTWTLFARRPAPAPGRWELANDDELVAAAAAHRLHAVTVRRYRPLRLPPYLLPIPRWLDRHAPVQLWSHCVAIFRRY
jgi:SAM-dependent methyltransferase